MAEVLVADLVDLAVEVLVEVGRVEDGRGEVSEEGKVRIVTERESVSRK